MITRLKMILIGTVFSLFMFVILFWIQFEIFNTEKVKSDDAEFEISESQPVEEKLITRLKCEKNETLAYDYESQTPIWGKNESQIYVSSQIVLHCLENFAAFQTKTSTYLVVINNINIEVQNKSTTDSRQNRNKFEKSEVFEQLLKSVLISSGKEKDNIGSTIEILTPSTVYNESRNYIEQNSKYFIPFIFKQHENGTLLHVMFAANDDDESIRNFKRHLVYTFVTSLDEKKHIVQEETIFGKQKTHYSSEPTDLAARRIFGWELQMPSTSPERVLIKRWMDSQDVLSPSKQNIYSFNDPHKVDIWYQHIQLIDNGKLINAQGINSFALSETLGNEVDEDEKDDHLTENFKAQSSFILKLRSRWKRSLSENIDINTLKLKFPFSHSSLLPTYTPESSLKSHLNSLYLEYDMKEIINKLVEENFMDTASMSKLLEIVKLEISLGKDTKVDSASTTLSKIMDEDFLIRSCSTEHYTLCHNLFQLYSLVGGEEAEKVLLSYVKNKIVPENLQLLATHFISNLPNPRIESINEILKIMKQSKDNDVTGSLAITVSIMATKKSITESTKSEVTEIILDILENVDDNCNVAPLTVDLFMAIGNVGKTTTLSRLLSHIESCLESESYQIIALNSLRQLVWHPKMQKWLKKLLFYSSCTVKSSLLNILTEEAIPHNKPEVKPTWPQDGFNDIDEIFHNWMTSKSVECPTFNEMYNYFKNKIHPKSEEILKGIPYTSYEGSKKRRSPRVAHWDHSTCNDMNDESAEEKLASLIFNNNLSFGNYKTHIHCFAERKFGKPKLNNIYSTGISVLAENENNFKMVTKLIERLHILGRNFDVGTIAFYNINDTTRVYVTLEDGIHTDILRFFCDLGTMQYQPFYHIPLYMFPMGVVVISFGIHISGDMNLTVTCFDDGVYRVEPVTKTRVALEAMATVSPVEAAVNVGATFNIHLDSYLVSSPNLCANSSISFDSMTISMEGWYRILPLDRQIIDPEFLKWRVGEGIASLWTEFCLFTDTNRNNTTLFNDTTTSAISDIFFNDTTVSSFQT